MINVKVGTKEVLAKEISIRCSDEYSVSIILADDITDIRILRNEFESSFDGTITLSNGTIISGLYIRDLTRNYREDDIRTDLHLTDTAEKNEE